MRFGTMIRAHRLRQNLSMDKVCKEVDLSKAYLSLIETGQKMPPKDEIVVQIARALGLDETDLVMRAHRERFPEDVLELRAVAKEMRATLARLNEAMDSPKSQSGVANDSADLTEDFFGLIPQPAPVMSEAETSTIRCAKVLHATLKDLERLLPPEVDGTGVLASEIEELRAEECDFLRHVIQGIKLLRPRRGPQTMIDD